MAEKKGSISRRNFLKTAGAVGVGSLLSPLESSNAAKPKSDTIASQSKNVPTRPFGKTGVDVPILGIGTDFINSSDLLKKYALNKGVHLWDTASSYVGGNEEKAIGRYFAKYPEDRKKVFLVTKSSATTADYWSTDLDKSLKRMNTSFIDLFLIHMVFEVGDLTPPTENAELWAEKAKSDGKIRFFGFSTHHNMENNLMKASNFGWIDEILFSYNFKIMHSEKMKKAVDACAKAGIGLLAMKTQATEFYGRQKQITPNEKEQALFNQLMEKGLTIEQAKLKAVGKISAFPASAH